MNNLRIRIITISGILCLQKFYSFVTIYVTIFYLKNLDSGWSAHLNIKAPGTDRTIP